MRIATSTQQMVGRLQLGMSEEGYKRRRAADVAPRVQLGQVVAESHAPFVDVLLGEVARQSLFGQGDILKFFTEVLKELVVQVEELGVAALDGHVLTIITPRPDHYYLIYLRESKQMMTHLYDVLT